MAMRAMKDNSELTLGDWLLSDWCQGETEGGKRDRAATQFLIDEYGDEKRVAELTRDLNKTFNQIMADAWLEVCSR